MYLHIQRCSVKTKQNMLMATSSGFSVLEYVVESLHPERPCWERHSYTTTVDLWDMQTRRDLEGQ